MSVSRASIIRDFLQQNAGTYYTVQEVCSHLGLPTGGAAHSIFTTFNVLRKQNAVIYRDGICSIMNKKCRTYTWAPHTATAAQQPAQPAQPAQPKPNAPRPRRARAAKPKAAPQQPQQPQQPPHQSASRLTPEQEARAAARRAAAAAGERARTKAAEDQSKADLLARAKQTFRSLTGVEPAPGAYAEMKRAYRTAALKLHPDRNGGVDKGVTVLNAAWTELERAYAS